MKTTVMNSVGSRITGEFIEEELKRLIEDGWEVVEDNKPIKVLHDILEEAKASSYVLQFTFNKTRGVGE